MKVTFVRPSIMPGIARDSLEPLVFAVLAALTPPGVERALYDERIESIPFDERTDLVALSVDTYCARRAYQIAGEYRRRGVPVVMGGHHPTFRPEEALQFATSVVVGDAEGVWPELVRDARRGALSRRYEGGYPPLEGLRLDRGIFRGKRYLPMSLVQFSRGCRYACDFCSVHAFYGRTLRHRPIREVIDEIERAGLRRVCFTDDNLFVSVARTRELLGALRATKVRWSCQTSLDIAANAELVRLMARSGCISVTIGFESLVEENLRQMGKPWNHGYGDYPRLVRVFRDQGIMVYGTFVFGYDHDTPDAIQAALEFALREKLFLANFNPLAPTPGTPLYDRLHREGRLIHDPWWLDTGYRYGQGMFHPRRMTVGQLAEGCYRARTQFNSCGGILRRALDFRANSRSLGNAGIFLAANLVTRRELHRKQGRSLGGGSALSTASGESADEAYAD